MSHVEWTCDTEHGVLRPITWRSWRFVFVGSWLTQLKPHLSDEFLAAEVPDPAMVGPRAPASVVEVGIVVVCA